MKTYQELETENKELKELLKEILLASEFYSQEGIADYNMRYAHESNVRLIKERVE